MITTFVFTFSVQYLAAQEALKGRTAGAELKVNIKCLSQAVFFFLFVFCTRASKEGRNKLDGGGGSVAKDTRQTPPGTL